MSSFRERFGGLTVEQVQLLNEVAEEHQKKITINEGEKNG